MNSTFSLLSPSSAWQWPWRGHWRQTAVSAISFFHHGMRAPFDAFLCTFSDQPPLLSSPVHQNPIAVLRRVDSSIGLLESGTIHHMCCRVSLGITPMSTEFFVSPIGRQRKWNLPSWMREYPYSFLSSRKSLRDSWTPSETLLVKELGSMSICLQESFLGIL